MGFFYIKYHLAEKISLAVTKSTHGILESHKRVLCEHFCKVVVIIMFPIIIYNIKETLKGKHIITFNA